MICDNCDKTYSGNHRAWCGECNKPHPICDVCYEAGISNGTLKDEKHNISDLDGAEKWV